MDRDSTVAPPSSHPFENQMQLSVPGVDPFTSARTSSESGPRRNHEAGTPPIEVTQRLSSIQREQTRSATMDIDPEPPNAPPRKPRTIQVRPGQNNIDDTKARTMLSRDLTRPISEDSGASDAITTLLPNQHKRTVSGSLSHGNSVANNPSAVGVPQRRSRRLFGKPPSIGSVTGARDASDLRKAKATGTKGRIAATSTVGRVVSGNRKPIDAAEVNYKDPRPQVSTADAGQNNQRLPASNNANDVESLQWLLELLGRLGSGYCSSSRFQCQAALSHYQSIPQQQRETVWVLAQVGKVLHEQGKYSDAERAFARIRKKVPSRMLDMEVYSTVLWHLKSDTELAFLSHELVDANRFAPQAWCTIGNSFSLQRDHDQALRCFKRATQLDPNFAYGFTLQGHEYSANEEYEKALQGYRKAVSADHRHYNGWYGLAKVYEKLGKYDMAEEHYRAAASINPTNAVLVWSIGMVNTAGDSLFCIAC